MSGCQGWSCTPLGRPSLVGMSCLRHGPGSGASCCPGGGMSCFPRPGSGASCCPRHGPGTGGGCLGWSCTPLRPPSPSGAIYSWLTSGEGGESCHTIGSVTVRRWGRQWDGEWWLIQEDIQAEGSDGDDWCWVEDGHPGQWRWLWRLRRWTWSGEVHGAVRIWMVAEREDEVGYLWWWRLEGLGLRLQDDVWTLGPAAPLRLEWAVPQSWP